MHVAERFHVHVCETTTCMCSYTDIVATELATNFCARMYQSAFMYVKLPTCMCSHIDRFAITRVPE